MKFDTTLGTYLSRPGPLYPRVPSSTGLTSSLTGTAGAGVSSVVAVSVAAGASTAASVVSAGVASTGVGSTAAAGATTGSSTGFVASDMVMVLGVMGMNEQRGR